MPGLGRIAAPDARDARFLMRAALPPAGEKLPTRKTWRFAYPVLDQGETSSCVGHAWKGFLMSEPIRSNASHPPSAFQLYDEACANDEFTENDNDTERQFGSSVRGGAKAMSKRGLVAQYLWAATLDSIVRWLLLKGPVVMGTDWYDSMFNPDDEGIVRITPATNLAGGHAYLLNRVNTKRGLFWGPQSWGPNYGVNGHFAYPFEVIERLLHQDGEACTAVEQRAISTLGVSPPADLQKGAAQSTLP